MPSRAANSAWSSGDCALTPRSVAPSAAKSVTWSRNAAFCGVHPRAPGISSQPSMSGSPGFPVRG